MAETLLSKTITVSLEGLSDFMFDRFFGHEKGDRPPEQKLYLAQNNQVVLPSENIWAFLFGESPQGCAKAFEGKGSKEFIRVGQSHLVIEPSLIPFTRGDEPIVFSGFDKEFFYVSEFAPRTKQGSLSIKQEIKKRPVLMIPWNLSFQLVLIKNDKIDENRLFNWFTRGGIEIALGTYRPRYGRFRVTQFE